MKRRLRPQLRWIVTFDPPRNGLRARTHLSLRDALRTYFNRPNRTYEPERP